MSRDSPAHMLVDDCILEGKPVSSVYGNVRNCKDGFLALSLGSIVLDCASNDGFCRVETKTMTSLDLEKLPEEDLADESVSSDTSIDKKNENLNSKDSNSNSSESNVESERGEWESRAAEILLSFGPSRKRVSSQLHCLQHKASDDSNDELNDSTMWIKSVDKRRSFRKAR